MIIAAVELILEDNKFRKPKYAVESSAICSLVTTAEPCPLSKPTTAIGVKPLCVTSNSTRVILFAVIVYDFVNVFVISLFFIVPVAIIIWR